MENNTPRQHRRPFDLSHLERQALHAEEIAAKARAEEAAVIIGVMETTSLEQARGAEFLEPEVKRGDRQRKPIRRLTGLQWLRRKGRITDQQLAVGERYGALWRAAKGMVSIRSNLNQSPAGGADRHRTMSRMVGEAMHRVIVTDKLAPMWATLGNSIMLIDALDRIAGQELTPREAARNGAEAAALEALVIVALDLLAKGGAPSD